MFIYACSSRLSWSHLRLWRFDSTYRQHLNLFNTRTYPTQLIQCIWRPHLQKFRRSILNESSVICAKVFCVNWHSTGLDVLKDVLVQRLALLRDFWHIALLLKVWFLLRGYSFKQFYLGLFWAKLILSFSKTAGCMIFWWKLGLHPWPLAHPKPCGLGLEVLQVEYLASVLNVEKVLYLRLKHLDFIFSALCVELADNLFSLWLGNILDLYYWVVIKVWHILLDYRGDF